MSKAQLVKLKEVAEKKALQTRRDARQKMNSSVGNHWRLFWECVYTPTAILDSGNPEKIKVLEIFRLAQCDSKFTLNLARKECGMLLLSHELIVCLAILGFPLTWLDEMLKDGIITAEERKLERPALPTREQALNDLDSIYESRNTLSRPHRCSGFDGTELDAQEILDSCLEWIDKLGI